MGHVIHVDSKGGDLFEIAVRHHVMYTDQPIEDGGGDAAPTPTELFVVSLASCVAFYARRFLGRHGLASDGLSVNAAFTMAERPARVSEIALSIRVPHGLSEERRAALLAVASHCTVHNSLEHCPRVIINLESQADVS